MTTDRNDPAAVGEALRAEALSHETFKALPELLALFGFDNLDQLAAETISDTLARSGVRTWPLIEAQLPPSTRVRLIPTGDPPVADAERSPAKVTGWWRWGRWVGFLLVSVLGGSALALIHRLPDPTTVQILSALLTGVAVQVAVIHLLGLGRYRWRRLRGRPIGYGAATYSPLVLVVALVLSFLSAGGAIEKRQQAATQAAIGTAGVRNSSELRDTQNAFLVFQKAEIHCTYGPIKSFATIRKRVATDEKARRSFAIGQDFAQGLAAARVVRHCLSGLPTGTPDLDATVNHYRSAGTLLVQGWTLYVRGWGPPLHQSLLNHGDRIAMEAYAELYRGDQDGNALYHRLGGATLLGDRLTLPPG